MNISLIDICPFLQLSRDTLASPIASTSAEPMEASVDSPEASTRKRQLDSGHSFSPPQEPSTSATNTSSSDRPSSPTAPKRQRRHLLSNDADSKGRGKRLFGMLNATLGQARKQEASRSQEVAKRLEVEARSQSRMKRKLEEVEWFEYTKRILLPEYQKEMELLEGWMGEEVAYRSMRGQKRRLASFLVSSGEWNEKDNQDYHSRMVRRKERRSTGRRQSSTGLSSARHLEEESASRRGPILVSPAVPSALAPLSQDHHRSNNEEPQHHPIYYLPRKLTLRQEDMLDDQEDQVDAELEEVEKSWLRRKKIWEEEVEEVKKGIEEKKKGLEKEREKRFPDIAATAAGEAMEEDK